MKPRQLILIALFGIGAIHAIGSDQAVIDKILDQYHYDVSQITPSADSNTIILSCDFSSNVFVSEENARLINSMNVHSVNLIYTKFRTDSTYDQRGLNKRRIQQLTKRFPHILDDRYTQWNVFQQTGCSSRDSCDDYFHGFYIVLKAESYEPPVALETVALKKLLTDFVELGDDPVLDSLWQNQDSTIFKVFQRHPQWKDMLIATDVTGSMSPYTFQMLIWHKLQETLGATRTKHYTFFNDGDLMPDFRKEVGDVGGIYHENEMRFETIEAQVYKTMNAGSGGDQPENNVEALIEGLKECGDCDDIIMIADNQATPRDIALINKIDRPVKFILCGTKWGINPVYLDLARSTKGSVHTIEEDIDNLFELGEGESIEFQGVNYTIVDGKFSRVTEL